MYAPSDEFVDKYAQTVKDENLDPTLKEALLNYLYDYLRPKNRLGISNRTVLLLLKGEGAIETFRHQVLGGLSATASADTVRGTFGDFIGYATGEMGYFEPAVLAPSGPEINRRQLALFAEYAERDGGALEEVIEFPPDVKPETTLVILKPENFRHHSSRAGNIIDIFSRSGLYIVGIKLFRFSVAQAEEFYAPLLKIFPESLKENVEERLRSALGENFDFSIPDKVCSQMGELLKDLNAKREFDRIVEYMSGVSPGSVKRPQGRERPGKERCLALLYRGVDAVQKIRSILGVTDPGKAAEGTVRSVLGYDMMQNAAHAADSVESAQRERKIIGLWGKEKSEEKEIILEYLAQSA
jgi:nucleoside diphosphate kinase